MAYEYEKDILELLKDIEKERSLDLSKEINEIQGTYQTARLIDNIVTTTKKRLTEQERKAKAWEELKEEIRSMFVWGSDLPKGTPSKYMNEAYGIVFKTMCELDGTNEFSNLLSDMQDE